MASLDDLQQVITIVFGIILIGVTILVIYAVMPSSDLKFCQDNGYISDNSKSVFVAGYVECIRYIPDQNNNLVLDKKIFKRD
jgi:hypothetical protein